MAWNSGPKGRNEFMTVGPYPFPHQRDAACNKLCGSDGRWGMFSSDIDRKTGQHFAIMARWVEEGEDA